MSERPRMDPSAAQEMAPAPEESAAEFAERKEPSSDQEDTGVAPGLERQVQDLRGEVGDLEEQKKSFEGKTGNADLGKKESLEQQIYAKKIGLAKMKIQALSSRIGKPDAAAAYLKAFDRLDGMQETHTAIEKAGGTPAGMSDAEVKKFRIDYETAASETELAQEQLGASPEMLEALKDAQKELSALEGESADALTKAETRQKRAAERHLNAAYDDSALRQTGEYKETEVVVPEIVQAAKKGISDTVKAIWSKIWQ